MFTGGFEKLAISASFLEQRIGGHIVNKTGPELNKKSPAYQKYHQNSMSTTMYHDRASNDNAVLKKMEAAGAPRAARHKQARKMVEDYKSAHHQLLPARQRSASAVLAQKPKASMKVPTKALLGLGGLALGASLFGIGKFRAAEKRRLDKKIEAAPVGQPAAQMENNHVVPEHLMRDPAYSLL